MRSRSGWGRMGAVLLMLYALYCGVVAHLQPGLSWMSRAGIVVVEAAVLFALWRLLFRYRPNPLTRRKLQRFRSIGRGYWSFVLLTALVMLSFFGIGELLVNNRALAVRYEGKWVFPAYGAIRPGSDFGLGYGYETNYRELKKRFAEQGGHNWVILPPVPYGPLEQDYGEGLTHPQPPNFALRHFLGTDNNARDIFARLFYGFRTAMMFSLLFMFFVYLIGIALGCAMGYFGGTFDLLVQRLIEIWANIPFLYIVIIVASVLRPTFGVLLLIFVVFTWTTMTYFLRTATYKERTRDYAAAARVLGASTPRILFHHIMPNTISTVVTFMPFTVVSAISSLTALDFLGFGLPPPTPSWGELLRRGLSHLDAPWIVASAFCGLVLVLVLVTFIGEAIREAFDPRRFTTYR